MLFRSYALRSDGQLRLKGQIANAAMGQVLELVAPRAAQRITGRGQLSVDLHAQGNSWEEIQSALAGRAVGDVHNGAVTGLNIVNDVLGRVTGLPQIGDLISANVKPKYARLFSDNDTQFETLHATCLIGGRRIATDDLAIIAADYGVHAAGWVGFDRAVDLSGTLAMSRRFSGDVIADIKEAKYVVDSNGQLSVPFRLRGTLGEIGRAHV